MKDALLDKINALKELASHGSRPALPSQKESTGKETALSTVIKTKEAADLFMKRLHALG